MSNISSSNHPQPVAGSPSAEEHELTTQTQGQSPVSTYREPSEDKGIGLSLRDRLSDRKNDFAEEERRDAWKVVDEAVKTYSDEMIQRWIAEMDTLLVYAGLFSAILTAFNVESYSLLSPTAPDLVLAALTQISAQLGSFSVHDPFVNSTQPAFQPSSVPSKTTYTQKWVVWLNALWFSSLICSLSAASIAIMVKQWIHEYNSGISGASRHTARLRQHRFNGLVKWKVAAVIAVLPILLQIALVLFLAGLLVLLWNLNRTVAIVASSLVGALLAFTLGTIILPTFSFDCAYLSPLSISLSHSCRLVNMQLWTFIRETAYSVFRRVPPESIAWRVSRRLLIAGQGSLPSPSIYAMQSAYVTDHPLSLDQDIFVTAYSTTGDLTLLEHASACFSNHPIYDLSNFFTRIHARNREYGQTTGFSSPSVHWTLFIPLDMASDMLLVRPRFTSGASTETSSQHTHSWQETICEYLRWSHVVPGGNHHRISSVLSNMAAVLYNNGDSHPHSFPMGDFLEALRTQIDSVKETDSAFTNVARRRVIAAIHTAVRTLMLHSSRDLERELCLNILISCSSPASVSRPQPDDIAEEDARTKILADAIALAEDALVRTLQSPEVQDGDSEVQWLNVKFFCQYYQRIGLEQLVGRVSEKMLDALRGAVSSLHPESDFDRAQKHGWLEWLTSLEKEYDRQISMRNAGQNERTRTSLRIARESSEEG